MKNTFVHLVIFSLAISMNIATALAQTSTFERVYQIFQTNCATPYCHSNGSQSAGLDLEGSGTTLQDKMMAVHSNLVSVSPSNANAASIGDHLIYEGRPDRSFLFRKINNGLESTIALESNEGDAMPKNAATVLTDVEKELVRQWILFGAPSNGKVVEEALLVDYYDNGLGNSAFPNGAPPAPAPSEGFQIKMGPFFVAPQSNPQGWADEVEYFQKWELNLPANQEVTRIDTKMGNYSHHFLMYSYDNASAAASMPAGLRTFDDHDDISLVEAIQEPTNLVLPQGSAFFWDNDIVLDLNSHYINYDMATVYKGEVYINVYTQPSGTASQEMLTVLIPNSNLYIPNNGNEYTFEQTINYNLGEVFLWSVVGHTHQWGTGYEVFMREPGNVIGEQIYDGACPQGIPGCNTPYFDYQHIPMRFFDELQPVRFNFSRGIVHRASYVNTGNSPVTWGSTSDDEMMVLVFMGLMDTTGVVTNAHETRKPLEGVRLFPNPATDHVSIALPETATNVSFKLYNLMGQVVKQSENINETLFQFERDQLSAGLYIYTLEDADGHFSSGKLIFR